MPIYSQRSIPEREAKEPTAEEIAQKRRQVEWYEAMATQSEAIRRDREAQESGK